MLEVMGIKRALVFGTRGSSHFHPPFCSVLLAVWLTKDFFFFETRQKTKGMIHVDIQRRHIWGKGCAVSCFCFDEKKMLHYLG
jgi:hypothetical protein